MGAFDAAKLDHVAVAVADIDAALAHWHALGAVPVAGGVSSGFASEQVRMAGGGKLEVIGALPDADGETFISAFLDRFGSGTLHHVTIKVPSLPDAAEAVREAGYDVVDYNEDYDFWHEFFLRPSQVGGIVAQVAWAAHSDADWATSSGRDAPPPAPTRGPSILGPSLRSTDMDAAARVWSTLGATIQGDSSWFTARWSSSPLTIDVEAARGDGVRSGPVGLRVTELGSAGQTPVAPPLLGRAGDTTRG